MSHYAKTALTTKDMPTCTEIHDAVMLSYGTGRGADLLAFPECEEYLTSSVNSGCLWYKSFVQGIVGRFDNKNDLVSYSKLYKERFQCTLGNQTIFFMFSSLTLIFFYMVFFFPWLAAVLAGGEFNFPFIFYEEFSECLYLMAISFAISKYFQYKLWNADESDNEGFYYNRLNGMVERRANDKTVCIPFNEFRPLAVQSRGPGGHTTTRLMLINDKINLVIPFPSNYLADAIICWCYLKQFMDISRPLPDIPEHEATRHLDPTTKKYDEETGRDPFYWRKKTEKEIKQLEEEARQRVKAQFKEGVYFH